MEMSCSDVEKENDTETTQEDSYSGEATFLYSSKINGGVNIVGACEALVASEAFDFALTSHGRIYFKENGRLRSQLLNIETTASGLGMSVRGHNDFVAANPGGYIAYSLSNAFDLLLSDKKLFNTAFGFPEESARIFMRPVAIRADGNEAYEMLAPYLRVYSGGVVSISLTPMLGFEDTSVRDVIYNEVNKSQRNISSVLCDRELFLASIECQLSKMKLHERLSQRGAFEAVIRSTLNAPGELNLFDESLTVYELAHNDQITLTDVARNMLSMADRAVALGVLRTRINWFGRQYRNSSIGEYWQGKPIIFISSHAKQQNSSIENWAAHKNLVNSVMARVYLNDAKAYADLDHSDMRSFDDFNNFYSESVSLVLSSAQVKPFIEPNSPFSFNNLASDVRVLSEVAHFIQIYYSYVSLEVDRCKKAIDVARTELNILKFEEAFLSAHKYGEIAKYLEEVKNGEHLTSVCKLLHKKIETVRKGLELDEKISSESYTRRITVIFGIIASATLSPELMQPLAKYYEITFDDELNKLAGIAASVVVVITLLIFSHYIFGIFSRIVRSIRK